MTPVTLAIAILGVVLIVLTASFVALPLFVPRLPGEAGGDDYVERWERQKRQALAAIKEAELDHTMGKLSDEDTATLRARLETQTLEAMAALERKERK